MLASLCLLSPAVQAQQDSNDQRLEISYDVEGALVKYGEYFELELNLEADTDEQVRWDVVFASLPAGVELEDSRTGQAALFGTPEFTGQWCFTVQARIGDSGKQGIEEVCLAASDNESMVYPRFKTDSLLEEVEQSHSFDRTIEVERHQRLSWKAEVASTSMPDSVRFNELRSRNEVELSGKIDEIGLFDMVIVLSDENDHVNYRQFRLNVVEEGADDQYQCPPGYYFDGTLGYCVQSRLDTCPASQYYDPVSDRCLDYDRSQRCGYNSYYDHWLNRCVVVGYPRCPWNYRYDAFFNRCVRTYFRCSYGEYYSHIANRCVRDSYHRQCGIGSHFSYALRRCVSNTRYCGVGRYWSPSRNRCVNNSRRRYCGSDVWDPRANRCVSRSRYRRCGVGSSWDSRVNRCVTRNHVPRCGPGSRWSPRNRRCEVYRRPSSPMRPRPLPRPMRPMSPAPRPRPMTPRPGPRPGPRPMNPRPAPRPRPMNPAPAPRPRPMNPAPAPRPCPMNPAPAPRPRPMNPAPAPRPRPMNPAPAPRPRPMNPRPAPRPRPMNPRPPRPMNPGRPDPGRGGGRGRGRDNIIVPQVGPELAATQ